jgi:hypothetical protein
MRRRPKVLIVLVAGACLATGTAGLAQAPQGRYTLWNFLGIPGGIQKLRDANANSSGRFPGLERKPPLKRIADPENLESDNPAIKTAAEAKQQEDLKKQKIKAIRYLATVGCGCYPGVAEALMAALDDCTEEVRYEAARAIRAAARSHCSGYTKRPKVAKLTPNRYPRQHGEGDGCSPNCCCTEEMSQKLYMVAYERDDTGCWLEPSARVREAARDALRTCCPNCGYAEPEAVQGTVEGTDEVEGTGDMGDDVEGSGDLDAPPMGPPDDMPPGTNDLSPPPSDARASLRRDVSTAVTMFTGDSIATDDTCDCPRCRARRGEIAGEYDEPAVEESYDDQWSEEGYGDDWEALPASSREPAEDDSVRPLGYDEPVDEDFADEPAPRRSNRTECAPCGDRRRDADAESEVLRQLGNIFRVGGADDSRDDRSAE